MNDARDQRRRRPAPPGGRARRAGRAGRAARRGRTAPRPPATTGAAPGRAAARRRSSRCRARRSARSRGRRPHSASRRTCAGRARRGTPATTPGWWRPGRAARRAAGAGRGGRRTRAGPAGRSAGVLAQQQPGDQEAADDEEDVDADVAALRCAEHVPRDDEQHRDRAQALHVRPVRRAARPAPAVRHAWWSGLDRRSHRPARPGLQRWGRCAPSGASRTTSAKASASSTDSIPFAVVGVVRLTRPHGPLVLRCGHVDASQCRTSTSVRGGSLLGPPAGRTGDGSGQASTRAPDDATPAAAPEGVTAARLVLRTRRRTRAGRRRDRRRGSRRGCRARSGGSAHGSGPGADRPRRGCADGRPRGRSASA